MVMFLKNNLNMSNGEIMMHFKGRGGFGTRTVSMILNGKFNPSQFTTLLEITALLPKKLKTINRTDQNI